RRGLAVAIALLVTAALAAAGCGFGAGKGLGEAELTVTRDFGAHRVAAPVHAEVTESDTVMRLLEREAKISTRYGGGFVQSIDGIEGGEQSGRRYDWFFYVNGLESPVGAADYALRGGDSVWWDYRDWSATSSVPAVVGSWPQPFAGSGGKTQPVSLECLGGASACAEVRSRLEQVGALERTSSRHAMTSAFERGGEGSGKHGIRVLVGPWARLRSDPAAAQIESGPRASGVFARFTATSSGSSVLWGLDEAGEPARRFGPDAGLVAATRRGEEPPVWVVTGATGQGIRAAAGLLDSRHLHDHYAVAVEGGKETPLPLASVFVLPMEPTRR
ncbi:MAG TPA: DUF4430 domain-containing protein, partial [Solirubrobacterales bacterium]|nr:DUF4430 domain-containing protein [Solirubrobacterales bacterium]